MKLLLFSDLHCDVNAARRIVELSPSVDVVVGAGDFATVRHGLHLTLEVLSQIIKPTVLVPGNSETLDELTTACEEWTAAHVLHGRGIQLEGIDFYGLGGAVPVTPFGSWSFDLTESQARSLLAGCPAGAVLVSHSPPQGAVDRSSSGKSLGSEAVRETIERQKPRLVVCGHIHESAGKTATIDATPVINAGPQGIVFELSR